MLERRRRLAQVVGCAFLTCALVGCDKDRDLNQGPRGATVKISAGSGWGAGFIVQGPSGEPLVATAYHVIASGEPVTVQREVEVSETQTYVEAFPDTTVAAFREDVDLALLRIRNLPPDRISALTLGAKPAKDSEVTSWGFPSSSVARNLGLTSKHGRISNMVKLPALDRLYARSIKEDAVDALIVSTELEPGFSGGPTIDASGKVVGVNVLKDKAHRGQNAAVNVSVLVSLLKEVKSEATAPTAADVVKLLSDIEADYLRLPVEQRHETIPTDVVSLSDLAVVARIAHYTRTYLWGSTGAEVGMTLAKMPGELLPTYLSLPTRKRVIECEKTEATGFAGLAQAATIADCRDYEVRPLVWDFVSATLQWEGQPRTYTAGKIEEVSAERRIYRAKVGVSNRASTFTVYLAADSGRLRLRLTDETGKLSALSAVLASKREDFVGKWKAPEEKRTVGTAEMMQSEALEVNVSPSGKLGVEHTFDYLIVAPKGNVYNCNGKRRVHDVLTQSFGGSFDSGLIAAEPTRDMERIGDPACPAKCGGLCAPYTADTSVILKRVGDSLYMYRTGGTTFPEEKRFVRDMTQDSK